VGIRKKAGEVDSSWKITIDKHKGWYKFSCQIDKGSILSTPLKTAHFKKTASNYDYW